jgi:hypothetical protein
MRLRCELESTTGALPGVDRSSEALHAKLGSLAKFARVATNWTLFSAVDALLLGSQNLHHPSGVTFRWTILSTYLVLARLASSFTFTGRLLLGVNMFDRLIEEVHFVMKRFKLSGIAVTSHFLRVVHFDMLHQLEASCWV